MCSLSAAIEYQGIQKGIQEGIEKGIQKGIQEGIEKGEIKAAINLINSGMTKEDTFKLLKTSKSAQMIVQNKLSNK